MSVPAVLDACVLYPASLRDTLLRCAEAQLFEVVWSARILDEVERNLGDGRATAVQARRLVTLMDEAFPDAMADVDVESLAGDRRGRGIQEVVTPARLEPPGR